QPYCATQDKVGAELSFQSRDTFANIKRERPFCLWGEMNLWIEPRSAQQVVPHAPTGIVRRHGSRELAFGIDCFDVVATCGVGHLERTTGESFIKETGAPRVLAGRFRTDPVCDFSNWCCGKQTRKRFEMHSFVLQGESQMPG